MEAIAPLGSVGAVTSQARTQASAQAVQSQELTTAESIGGAALRLIQASIVQVTAQSHDLDVFA